MSLSQAVRDALYKLGTLLIATGWRLRYLSRNDPSLKDLAAVHETLKYSADALSKIAKAAFEEDSREKHDL